ncbi:MAG TPA: alkaline phosphatase family protein [Bryobacteraceae bacterium]
MNRRTFIQSAAALAPMTLTRLQAQPGAGHKTRHIVLFTSDGVRWQDLFTGIDPNLMNRKRAGMDDAGTLQKQLWRVTAEERRKALMPFFWNTLVPKGILFGNVSKGSSMQVTNRYRVSYPGYSEILTGRAQDDVIKGNDSIQNPTPSFLPFLKQTQHLKTDQVAVFASWDNFHYSAENQPGDIFVNAGYEASSLPKDAPKTEEFNKLQFEARFVADSSRHDAFTFGLAKSYLEKLQPEHLFISFDETDDWAHSRRYDRVLESLQYFDRTLQELWTYLQNSPKYTNSTTLIITTDHGRGSTLEDFSDHGPKVPGDEQIWAAFIGPDTPATGEATNTETCYQRDIAPTILDLLGFDYRQYTGVQGKPIPKVAS